MEEGEGRSLYRRESYIERKEGEAEEEVGEGRPAETNLEKRENEGNEDEKEENANGNRLSGEEGPKERQKES